MLRNEEMIENPYQSVETTIEDIITETPNIKTFVLRPKRSIEFKTGQFVQLTVPGLGEAPFTPSSSPETKTKLELTVMDVGMVTSALHQMSPNDTVGLRGPYGEGYPLEKFEGKEVLIVGGGVGLAPLRSLLLSLFLGLGRFKKVLLRYGARTPEDLLYKKELGEWKKEKVDVRITVDEGDKGWRGHVGLVTTILEKIPVNLKNSVAVVCGPPIMMKFVTLRLLDFGYRPENIYLSMEKNMSCGIGKCGHCRLGNFYVCQDGPVFTYDKIKDVPYIWD